MFGFIDYRVEMINVILQGSLSRYGASTRRPDALVTIGLDAAAVTVSTNLFTPGSIPAELGNIGTLRLLELDNNKLTGELCRPSYRTPYGNGCSCVMYPDLLSLLGSYAIACTRLSKRPRKLK